MIWEMSGTPTKDGDILTYTYVNPWDMGSKEGDATVIKHSVSCCRCGKSELLEFQNASDFIYFDDNMKELGWEKDKHGRWFCNDCSYKGGDD